MNKPTMTPSEMLAKIKAQAKIVGQTPVIEEKVVETPKPKIQKKSTEATKPKKQKKAPEAPKPKPKVKNVTEHATPQEEDPFAAFPELDPELQTDQQPKITKSISIADIPFEAIESMLYSYSSQYGRELEKDRKAEQKAQAAGVRYAPSPRVRDLKKVEQFLQKFHTEPTK